MPLKIYVSTGFPQLDYKVREENKKALDLGGFCNMEGLGLPPPELTEQELEVVTTVFRNYETGLREATIFPKVGRCWKDNQTLHGLQVFKMPKA